MKMKNFLFMPEGNKWRIIQAYTPESVYSLECCWYLPKHRIAIVDLETNETFIFTREVAQDGTFKVLKEERIAQ